MTQPPYPPVHGQPDQQDALPGCWWHPNRQTGLRCARCDRPACPDCLREASVGYQCVDCVHAARREQRTRRAGYRRAGFGTRTVAGARLSQRTIVTPILIAINVAVFVVTAAQAGSVMQNQFAQLSQDGVLWPYGVTFLDQWWRLLTSGFLHYGLIHVAMNMIALWILGRDLEMLLGKLRYIGVYLVSLLGGSAAVYAFGDVGTATAGASGAIFGLMGGIAVAVLRLRLNPTAALGVIVLNVVISFSIEGISLLGHLGGLVVGALAVVAMVYAPQKNRAAYQGGALLALTAALVVLIVVRDGQLADLMCRGVNGQVLCPRPGA